MDALIHLASPNDAVQLFGIRLLGITAENGRKLFLSLVFIALVISIRTVSRFALDRFTANKFDRLRFWGSQVVSLFSAAFLILGLLSVWFDDPARLATAFGLVTAGLAFALQQVVTAVAGYFVILRGKTFNVGDRIRMGGVRGDVLALGFMQTTIMEMGKPPTEEEGDTAAWVESRQYTGRMVTVSNAQIFAEPVYNYTKDFPFIWDEIHVRISLAADDALAERIMLDAATEYSVSAAEFTSQNLAELKRRYFFEHDDVEPRVFYRLDDDRMELTVRFIVHDHGTRETKDAITRKIHAGFRTAGIVKAERAE